MYDVTTQELMVFVVLGFAAGVFTSFYLTRIFEVVHMWRLLREVVAHLLLMCLGVVEDVSFLKEIKRKQMVAAEFTEEQIRNFEELDERALTNWKDSVILSIVAKSPPNFRSMMPFKTWREAMNFMNQALKGD